MRLYIRNNLLQADTWYPLTELSQLQITWDPVPGIYYTIIMYDVDAPYPNNPINSPVIHLLITNILGNNVNTGQTIFGYSPPSPPIDSDVHRYLIYLFKQKSVISPLTLNDRTKFPLGTFINQYSLQESEYETLIVDPINQQFYRLSTESVTRQENQVTFNQDHPLIMANSGLSDVEQNFCSCVVEVAVKQPAQCNLEKAWFEMRDGRECYNPFAICAASTHGANRKCYKHYNYDILSDDQITSLANLVNVQVNSPLDRSITISTLRSK